MATHRTLASAAVVMNRRCTSLILPSGNSTTRRTLARPRKASTAAPPVSPEVAQTMVRVRCLRLERALVQARQQLHRHVLERQGRAVEQLQQPQARIKLAQGRDGGVGEAGVGLGGDLQ